MTEPIAARLFLTREEAEYLIEDLRHAANYGTEWDRKLNSFADSLKRQLVTDVVTQRRSHEANCDLADCPRCG